MKKIYNRTKSSHPLFVSEKTHHRVRLLAIKKRMTVDAFVRFLLKRL